MVNKDVAKVVELYFQGHSVHEAIGIIRFDLKARTGPKRTRRKKIRQYCIYIISSKSEHMYKEKHNPSVFGFIAT